MGCFAFKCKKCKKPINSDSTSGHHCRLFLLRDGKVIEEMMGQYNSYGSVFKVNLDGSLIWDLDWSDICTLMFDDSTKNGIAAFHTSCSPSKNENWEKTRSEDDDDQGWGNYITGKNTEGYHKVGGKIVYDSRKHYFKNIEESEERIQKVSPVDAEYISFQQKSKDALKEMYPIKQEVEKLIWDKLVILNPKISENEDLKDPMSRSMYIHALVLGMFDIFNDKI